MADRSRASWSWPLPLGVSVCVCALALEPPPPINLTGGLAALQLTDDDITNTRLLGDWLGEAYHSDVRYDREQWRGVTLELERLADLAGTVPALAFAVGTALYSYFWWEDHGGVNLDAGERAVALMQRSIEHGACHDPSLGMDVFLERGCSMKWRQLMLLSAETSRLLAVDALDVRRAARALRRTSQSFEAMRRLPLFRQFEALGATLRNPHDMNFNMDYYPHVNVGPIWRNSDVPVARFLEEHFDEFRADLRRIMKAETFWHLHTQAFVSETQFTPRDADWQTVYLFINQKWVDRNCEVAPRTCELLRQRPEISQCRSGGAGAGFLRLRPGARLKPHYGNGPRLSAHLGLVVPEAGDIHMSVGASTVRWAEGRVVVFDDTYIHKVRHDGEEPRFVLLLWFCHPCDSDNWDNPPTRQPEICRWPR